MKILAKAALGALMLAGATALTATPAAARVDIGIGFGFPGYYYGPPAYPYYAYCDRWSRWYDPYRCGYYDDYDYYDGPVFIDGFWFDGPFRSRFFHGHREFFHNGGWHSGTGFRDGGFRHGGGFSGGRGNFSGSGGTWHGGSGGGNWHGDSGGSWHSGGMGGGHRH
ncbi:MAG TPA: hypothetical protein VFO27_14790 [Bryobacteraceae bacterium]|nr:hypothetical protein [Bryobacteraceae bacterium]